jgi:hypothetical protein
MRAVSTRFTRATGSLDELWFCNFLAAWENFYRGPVYQDLEAIRDACGSARVVCVEGATPSRLPGGGAGAASH